MRAPISVTVLALVGACNLPYPARATDASMPPDAFVAPGTIMIVAAKGPFYLRSGGDTVAIDVSITRGAGVTGDATITVESPPSGVTFDPLTIPDGIATGQLVAHGPSAPYGTGVVTVMGAIGASTNTDTFTLAVIGKPGLVDTTFGSAGAVAFGGASTTPIAVIAQDVNVVAIGKVDDGFAFGFIATRFLPNGQVDSTFGGGTGTVSYDFAAKGITGGLSIAAATQGDGKIVIGGSGSNGSDADPIIARITADGALDTTLGPMRSDTTSANDAMDTVAVSTVHPVGMPDVILLGGVSVGSEIPTLMELKADGTYDSSFGRVSRGSTNQTFVRLLVQTDGKIVALANGAGGTTAFGALRFNTDGSFDSFAPPFPSAHAMGFPVDCGLRSSTGFFCWGSDTESSLSRDVTVWDKTVDGAQVGAFGNSGGTGVYESPAMSKMAATALVALPDASGYVVLATDDTAQKRLVLIGLDATGIPDPAYGTGGIAYGAMPYVPIAGVALTNHRLVVVGVDSGASAHAVRAYFW